VVGVSFPFGATKRRPLRGSETTVSQGSYFALTWSARAGRSYRVHYKADVEATNWTDLAGDIFAYGSIASKADPEALPADSRFYRVVLVRQLVCLIAPGNFAPVGKNGSF